MRFSANIQHDNWSVTDTREAGLDALRLIAAVMVVMVHCQWEYFAHCGWVGEYWSKNVQYYVKVISFVGVPVFFAISGYFSHTFDTPARVWHMMKRMALIYFVMAGCLALVNLPLWVVSEGKWPEWSRVFDEILCCRAMWYIRDMVVIIPLLYLLNRFMPSYRRWAGWLIIPAAVLNYFVGNIWEDVATVTFVGIPSILIGVWIRTYQSQIERYITLRGAVWVVLVGLALSIVEVVARINNGTAHDQIYLLGMPVVLLGLFMLGLNRAVNWPPIMAHFGRRYSAWIYAMHPAALVVLLYAMYKVVGVRHWTFPLLALLVGVGLPMIITYIVRCLRCESRLR